MLLGLSTTDSAGHFAVAPGHFPGGPGIAPDRSRSSPLFGGMWHMDGTNSRRYRFPWSGEHAQNADGLPSSQFGLHRQQHLGPGCFRSEFVQGSQQNGRARGRAGIIWNSLSMPVV